MTFTLRWPDGRVQECWSPSLVVHEHLAVGASHLVPDLLVLVRAALEEASERVRARYGFPCSAATASLAAVEAAAAGQAPTGRATVVAMHPGLPAASVRTAPSPDSAVSAAPPTALSPDSAVAAP